MTGWLRRVVWWVHGVSTRVLRRRPSQEVVEARRHRAELERLTCEAQRESDAIMDLIGSTTKERRHHG